MVGRVAARKYHKKYWGGEVQKLLLQSQQKPTELLSQACLIAIFFFLPFFTSSFFSSFSSSLSPFSCTVCLWWWLSNLPLSLPFFLAKERQKTHFISSHFVRSCTEFTKKTNWWEADKINWNIPSSKLGGETREDSNFASSLTGKL